MYNFNVVIYNNTFGFESNEISFIFKDPIEQLHTIKDILKRNLEYDIKNKHAYSRLSIENLRMLLKMKTAAIYTQSKLEKDTDKRKKIEEIFYQICLEKPSNIDLNSIDVIKQEKLEECQDKIDSEVSLCLAIDDFSKNNNLLTKKIIYTPEGKIDLKKTLESFQSLTVLELLHIFNSKELYPEYDSLTILKFMETSINAKTDRGLKPLRKKLFSILECKKIEGYKAEELLKELYHKALEYHEKEIYKYCLRNGARFNPSEEQGKKAFLCVIRAGDIETFEYFLWLGADVNGRTLANETPLISAVMEGNKEIIKRLLKSGAKFDDWLLIDIVEEGVEEIFTVFLECGIDVNAPYEMNKTLLMYATVSQQEKIIKMLLEKGVDINAQDENGLTALMFATTVKENILECLIKAGADINAQDKDGRTALILAAQLKNVKAFELLLKEGADMSIKDISGRTAAQYMTLINFAS